MYMIRSLFIFINIYIEGMTKGNEEEERYKGNVKRNIQNLFFELFL